MAYDESLAGRIREALSRSKGIVEKKMFGGVGFMLHGNMLVGVWKDSLIARIGPNAYAEARHESHVREFDITGRPMKGWVMVEPDGLDEDASLQMWIERAIQYVETLPAK
jgi:TfoX/Sxy family transcriptional regulator of competence genes